MTKMHGELSSRIDVMYDDRLQPEYERLAQQHDELLVKYIFHGAWGQSPAIDSKFLDEHRTMEAALVAWFGRLMFWEKRDQLTEVLKMTGAIL